MGGRHSQGWAVQLPVFFLKIHETCGLDWAGDLALKIPTHTLEVGKHARLGRASRAGACAKSKSGNKGRVGRTG